MAEQKRRHFTARQKVAILREHFLERKEVSRICESHKIQPSLFYYWQRQFFENGEAAFERDAGSEQQQLERKVEALEQKLSKKDAVIAEVTEEYVKLKKELGEL